MFKVNPYEPFHCQLHKWSDTQTIRRQTSEVGTNLLWSAVFIDFEQGVLGELASFSR